jgi:hypothetical protein
VRKYWTVRAAAAAAVAVTGVVIPARIAVSAPAVTCSPSLQKVALSPASVPGGAGSAVTATLSCATPRALTIGLKGFAGVSVPSALHVAVGKSSASAGIATATTKTARRGWIVATLGSVRHQALLTIGVTPRTCPSPVLASATLPALATVGDHPVLALRLSCAAGAAVHLSVKSGNANVPVPATVTIGRYYSAANIALAPKAAPSGQYKSTITVHYGTRTLTRVITVNPGISKLVVSPFPNHVNGFMADIVLTGNAPAGGTTVTLKSGNSAVVMPASITIPAGFAFEVTGPTTISGVTQNTVVTLSATVGSRTASATVTVYAPWNTSDTLTISPAFVAGPVILYGQTVQDQFTVELSNPAPSSAAGGSTGVTVAISSDNPDVVVEGASRTVLIQAGFTTATALVGTASVASPVHAHLTATVGGTAVSASVPVTLEPGLTAVTAPATITGGDSATGTITLAGSVDVASTVELTSSSDNLTVPASVVIQPGQSLVTFPITTTAGAPGQQVIIHASLPGSDGGTTVTLS